MVKAKLNLRRDIGGLHALPVGHLRSGDPKTNQEEEWCEHSSLDKLSGLDRVVHWRPEQASGGQVQTQHDYSQDWELDWRLIQSHTGRKRLQKHGLCCGYGCCRGEETLARFALQHGPLRQGKHCRTGSRVLAKSP